MKELTPTQLKLFQNMKKENTSKPTLGGRITDPRARRGLYELRKLQANVPEEMDVKILDDTLAKLPHGSWLSFVPCSEGLTVRFPVRAQARAAGSVAGQGACRGQPTEVCLCLSLSPVPSSL